jgi:acyl-CoA synthetase (AMP-forming)/AMP-acid ligase II
MNSARDLLSLLDAAPGRSIAVVIPETKTAVTYAALREQVMSMAETLAGLGIRRGDRVASVLQNGLPAIVTFLAASIAGITAPLNPGYRYDELSFYLEDTSARLLLCPTEGADDARRAAEKMRIPIYSVAMESSGSVGIMGASARAPVAAAAPEDIALVLHTSGSTGRPKRVPLKHINLAISSANIANTYALTSDDVSLCVMPLFHVHGLVASTLATFLAGGTVVVPSKFNPLSFWRTARDHRVSWYSAVPTIHQLVLARTGERPESIERLRFVRSCSAALMPRLMEKMESIFRVPALEAYGMTEAAHQMCSNPLPPRDRVPGSVGPGTGVRVGIIDENGNHLSQGQVGEVVIQGPTVISGYESNPEANAASFQNGWFRTGDQGKMDVNGYMTLTGRIKELINRGGEKIAPPEIDEVLLSHPSVAEAVAFGMPHPTWGEEVAAAVVLHEPLTELVLLRFCKERLADFKCPRKIHIVEAIPRTATGKIQRRAMAAAFAGSRS